MPCRVSPATIAPPLPPSSLTNSRLAPSIPLSGELDKLLKPYHGALLDALKEHGPQLLEHDAVALPPPTSTPTPTSAPSGHGKDSSALVPKKKSVPSEANGMPSEETREWKANPPPSPPFSSLACRSSSSEKKGKTDNTAFRREFAIFLALHHFAYSNGDALPGNYLHSVTTFIINSGNGELRNSPLAS